MATHTSLTDLFTDIADSIREKTGDTATIVADDFPNEIINIPSGGGAKLFTGHYDAEGLATIGWSTEEIQYYQDYGVQWNSDADNDFKLTATELAGDDSNTTRFLPKNTTKTNFSSFNKLIAIPLINASITTTKNMFNGCYSLTAIPLLNTSAGTDFSSMFSGCYSLMTIPLINTSAGTDFSNMFYGCSGLKTIPLINTSAGTDFSSMFNGCYSLAAIPLLNTSAGTDFSRMFNFCYPLQKIPQIDTHLGTNFNEMFSYCSSLSKLPELDASSCVNLGSMFYGCNNLIDFGGLKDIGEAYLTSQSASYSYYSFSLTSSSKLTYDSLMNVINNLYDIATKGVATQKLQLGSTNKGKLTAEEIAIATNKGWTVS